MSRKLSPSAVALLLLALVVAGCLLGIRRQALTGDETRYLMYARGLIEHGRLVMTAPEWQALYLASTGSTTTDLPTGGGGLLIMHGVYLPTLMAPFALFGLAGLRDATLLVGLLGMAALFALCRRTADGAGDAQRIDSAALLATAVAVGTIPLLPYLHLFYMEAFLFTLVSVGWWRLSTAGRSLAGDVLTAVLILFIPYVHLRGSVVAAVLYALLLWKLETAGQRRRAILFALLGGVALAALLAANLAIYGVITGPVNSARPPLPGEWFAVLSMQLFNVRHGLLAYSPVWILGYAGLAVGVARGVPMAREGLALAVMAAVTGVGVNPGECPPARFWVLSVPMLAVGFCLWWRHGRGILLRGITVLLLGFTLLNTVQFLSTPNAMLENRQGSGTYAHWFKEFPELEFGLPLPVETNDPQDARTAEFLFVSALVFAAFATTGAVRRPLWAIPSALLLLAAIDAAEVRLVPPNRYEIERSPGRLLIHFDRPLRAGAGYLQIGAPWKMPYGDPYWAHVTTTTTGADGRASTRTEAARQVFSFSCRGPVSSILLQASPGFDLAEASAARLQVFRSRSFVWRYWPGLRQEC